MEIIPMMVVLICAAAGLGASALELRIPGLGRMNLEFTMDKHRTTAVEDSALEDQTEGQGVTENPTTSPGQVTQNPKESTAAKDDEVTEKNDEESNEADQTTEAAKAEAVTEAPNKTTEAASVTAAKESKQSTKAKDAEQSDTTETQEAVTTEKGDQITAQAATTVNSKETTKAIDKKNDEVTTESAKPTENPKQNQDAATPNVDSNPDEVTEEDAATSKKDAKDEEQSEAAEKLDTATTQKGDQSGAQAETSVDAKESTKASTEKKDEVTTESANPTENPKQNQNAATPNADSKPGEVTDQDDATSKADEDEDDDDDDFDMSDVWDDVEEAPEEFGREYDLDPKLLQPGNDLGDFQPKLELPSDMVKDMFHKMPADGSNTTEEEEEGVAQSEQEGGFFDRLKKFFSFGNLVEQLDTIPGKVQSLLDQFRQKKSDGLKLLREKMDASSETVGNKITEALARLKPAPEGALQRQCLERIQESFKQYEAALQRGIKPCIEKAQSVLGKQEGALKTAMGKFSQLLTDMQGCAQKLERSSISTFVSSILHMGSCTANDIKSKIENTLQPRMERLSELIQRHSTALNGNLMATGSCVERQLQLPKFQHQQQELVSGGKRCLQSSSRQ